MKRNQWKNLTQNETLLLISTLAATAIKWLCITVILVTLLSSCVTYERCMEKFGKTTEGPKLKTELQHVLPEAKAGFDITRSELQELAVGSRKESTSGKTTASITRTTEQDYRVDCNTPPDTIRVPVEVQCPPTTVFQPDPEIIYETPWYNMLFIGGLLVICAYLSFRLWLAGRQININIPGRTGLK